MARDRTVRGLHAVVGAVGARRFRGRLSHWRVYLSRSALQLERAVTGPNPNAEVGREALGRWITGYAVVLIVLVFALWDTVFKPRLQ